MSVLLRRRAQELAQLRAGGWTVVTESPLARLRAARQARVRTVRPRRVAGADEAWVGWWR